MGFFIQQHHFILLKYKKVSILHRWVLLAIIYLTYITPHNAYAATVVQDAWNAVQAAKDSIAPAEAAQDAAQEKIKAAKAKVDEADEAVDAATSSAERATAQEAKNAANQELTNARIERNTARDSADAARQYANNLEKAVSKASSDVVGISMCQVTSILSGGISKAIATLAIFSVGIGLFMGKFNWIIAFATSAGIAVIFNISAILGFITGGSGASNPCIVAG